MLILLLCRMIRVQVVYIPSIFNCHSERIIQQPLYNLIAILSEFRKMIIQKKWQLNCIMVCQKCEKY